MSPAPYVPMFTRPELQTVAELLLVAERDCKIAADILVKRNPESSGVQKLRIAASTAAAFRKRIEKGIA